MENNICNKCTAVIAKAMWCSRCKRITYCSKACQKADWPVHKPHCIEKDFMSVLGKKVITEVTAQPQLQFVLDTISISLGDQHALFCTIIPTNDATIFSGTIFSRSTELHRTNLASQGIDRQHVYTKFSGSREITLSFSHDYHTKSSFSVTMLSKSSTTSPKPTDSKTTELIHAVNELTLPIEFRLIKSSEQELMQFTLL